MQFTVIAYDFTDEGAFERRLAARAEHLASGERMKADGELLYAAALQDDALEKMIGSVMVVEFPSRSEVDQWLAAEPYLLQKVWEKVEIFPCKVAPFFASKI